MRRYSEIPNTPTPFGKSPELRIGSTVHLCNTGSAILRYLGPVEGKSGKFAGIELLGESASLGKNSGDVNGVKYFSTAQPGAGLFMSYEKLLSTLEYAESPAQKRLSLVKSPATRVSQTPSRPGISHSQTTTVPSTIKRNHPAARSHNSTPPLRHSLSQSSPHKSPIERELQRLTSAKAIVESERDNLYKEVQEIRDKLRQNIERLAENESSILILQQNFEEAQFKLERANERVLTAENKLIKQRRGYEDQRKELLEVIDQVESQVNDNERLYIGELKKLQEELEQKQVIIDDLQTKQIDLQRLYEKQKNGTQASGDKQIDELQGEINNLKLTNLTQVKAIEQLRSDLKDKEQKINALNKDSLDLKEAHINDRQAMEYDSKEKSKLIKDLQDELAGKNSIISELHEKLDELSSKAHEISNSTESEKSTIDDADIIRKEYESKILEFTERIKTLEEELHDSKKNQDKIYEFEFLLENKEVMIKELRKQLSEVSIQNLASESAKETNMDNDELTRLKEQLEIKDNELEDLNEQIKTLKITESELVATKTQLNEKDQIIKQREDEIAKAKESEMENVKSELESKDHMLAELRLQIEDLTQKLNDNILEKNLANNLSEEKAKLVTEVSLKDSELAQLKDKIKYLEQHANDYDGRDNDLDEKSSENPELLEEKILEIELLKEEILQLKSTDTHKELGEMKKELSSVKRLNRFTTNQELLEQIQLLQKELESRPKTNELQQLRSELELSEELRRVDNKSKDKEIFELREKLYERQKILGQKSQNMLNEVNNRHSTPVGKLPQTRGHTSMTDSPIKRPSVLSQVVDGALQVYVPENKEPSNGRALWCGLCEREGHDSIDCPYENDIF